MERVKRLAGNEIELGMKIPTIKILGKHTDDKGNNICCHYGTAVKDLRRICGNQYEHPSSVVRY